MKRIWKYTLIYRTVFGDRAIAKMSHLNGPDNFIKCERLEAWEIGQEMGGN